MRKYVPRFVSVSLLIFALSLIVYAVCINSAICADIVNGTVSQQVFFQLLYRKQIVSVRETALLS